jgi:NAD(P)-dependent dehydrogenase (short-subunit alcohol dehydrogenase family)
MNSKDFDGKNVLVTGAGQGIGRDICVELSRQGAHVIAFSRTLSHLETLQSEIQQEGNKCSIYTCDFEKMDNIKSELNKALETHKVDLLVNNAGMNVLSPFLEAKEEDWDTVMNVNLKSTFIISQLVARQMVKNAAGGVIVNISSQASLIAITDHTSYCVAKGGLDQLTRVMANELGGHNIRVNSVNPTVVLTKLGKEAWGSPEKGGPMLEKIPLKKFAEVSDITNVVLFLLSSKAAMVNGIIMPVDGGFLCTR